MGFATRLIGGVWTPPRTAETHSPPAQIRSDDDGEGGLGNPDINGQGDQDGDNTEMIVAENVLLRNRFYQSGFYALAGVVAWLAVTVVVAIVAATFAMFRPARVVYFAITTDGGLVKLKPLTDPVVSDNELIDWVARAVTDAYSFDYANYRRNLESVRQDFTADGFNQFLTALKAAGILDAVVKNSYVVSTVVTAAPVLTAAGIYEGTYSWKLQVPVVVTYASSAQSLTQPMLFTVIVARGRETAHPNGLAISQFIATNRNGNS